MARRARKTRAGLERWNQLIAALRLMNFAFTNVRTYPATHPEVVSVVTKLHETLHPIIEENEDVGFGFMDALLYIEGTMSLEETNNNQMLVERFAGARVKYLTISKGVEVKDLVGFFQVVNQESLKPTTESRNELLTRQGVGHVRIVEAELDDAASKSKAARKATLLDWYARVIGTLGKTQEALKTGAEADLTPLFRVIEDMMVTIRSKGAEPFLLLPRLATGFDPHLAHAVNVAVLCCALADRHGLNSGQINTLCTMAFLHDLGRLIIPPEWAAEHVPLSPEEKAIVSQHADWGFLLLARHPALEPQIAALAGRHHERASAAFTPDVFHRILAVADAFDLAMAGDTYYWKQQPPDRVIKLLLARAGERYRPAIVKLLVNAVGYYPMGTLVQLDDGRRAITVRPHPALAGRPKVWLFEEEAPAVVDAQAPADAPPQEPPPVILDLSELDSGGLGFARSVVRTLTPDVDVRALLDRKKEYLLGYSI